MDYTPVTGAIQDAQFMANVTGNTYYVIGHRYDIKIADEKPTDGVYRVLEECKPMEREA